MMMPDSPAGMVESMEMGATGTVAKWSWIT